MRKQHRHRALISEDWGYVKCIAPHRCDPAAHGAVMVVSVCRCGFVKETNRNGGRVEPGTWREPRPSEYPELLQRVREGVGTEAGKERVND